MAHHPGRLFLSEFGPGKVMPILTCMYRSGIEEINLCLTYFSSTSNEGYRSTELISLNLLLSGVLQSFKGLDL